MGLDISTSITGLAIVDDNGKIVHTESVDTRNSNKYIDLFSKVREVKRKLENIKHAFQINEIFIEQSLQMFRPGMSSAKTLSTLSKCNGMVSWVCYEIFEIKPQYIAATSARKLNGITVPRGSKSKEVVLQHLVDTEKDFVVEYTAKGNPKPNYYDIADAIIIARSGQIKCQVESTK